MGIYEIIDRNERNTLCEGMNEKMGGMLENKDEEGE